MTNGIDSPLDCSKQTDWITSNSYQFACRYFRTAASKWPHLTDAEAKTLSQAGLKIVTVWESRSDVLEHFSFATGVDEGTTAYRQAMLAGQPARTPIYFAVDFDC